MPLTRTVKFNSDDRDWTFCSFSPNLNPNDSEKYERCILLSVSRAYSWAERKELVDFLRSKGIICDLDEYDGTINILPDRKHGCAQKGEKAKRE